MSVRRYSSKSSTSAAIFSTISSSRGSSSAPTRSAANSVAPDSIATR